MKNIKSYYYFTGETVDGEFIDAEPEFAITKKDAYAKAYALLKDLGGGHLDAWYSETDEFAFDVEV